MMDFDGGILEDFQEKGLPSDQNSDLWQKGRVGDILLFQKFTGSKAGRCRASGRMEDQLLLSAEGRELGGARL